MGNNVSPKKDMILKAQSVNADISALIEKEKIINTSLAKALKKMEHTRKIQDISIRILSWYSNSNSFIGFNENKRNIVIRTKRSIVIDLKDILDLSVYDSQIEQTRLEFLKNNHKDDFYNWEDDFIKNLPVELKKKCEPILNEIIEELNSYTEYKFFVSSFEPYKAIQTYSGKISAEYKLTVDFK